jgi:Ni,Fe-hydrogenase III small subunit
MGWLKRSPWVFHYNASSCNGCDLELLAAFGPRYDPERFGVINTGNPKHADILLITGTMNVRSAEVARNLYDQMPSPKAVVAVGICATSACVFQEAYNVLGGVDAVLPVDVYVPGCAVRPESVLDGILDAVRVLDEKERAWRTGGIVEAKREAEQPKIFEEKEKEKKAA